MLIKSTKFIPESKPDLCIKGLRKSSIKALVGIKPELEKHR